MNAIFVIGVPRSGTSCICGILHRLGVRMTLNEFIPASNANPTGFYEDKEILKIISFAELCPTNGTYLQKLNWIKKIAKI